MTQRNRSQTSLGAVSCVALLALMCLVSWSEPSCGGEESGAPGTRNPSPVAAKSPTESKRPAQKAAKAEKAVDEPKGKLPPMPMAYGYAPMDVDLLAPAVPNKEVKPGFGDEGGSRSKRLAAKTRIEMTGVEKASAGTKDPLAAVVRKLKADVDRMEREWQATRNKVNWLTFSLLALVVILVTVCVVGVRALKKELRRARAAHSRPEVYMVPAGHPWDRDGLSNIRKGRPAPSAPAGPPPVAAPVRPVLPKAPEVRTQLHSLIDLANRTERLKTKPTMGEGPWRMGFATVTGHVREENQDYILGFEVANHQALIAADGCGGTPYGQRAAHLAVTEAAEDIMGAYGAASRWNMPAPTMAAKNAMLKASERLGVEGDKLNVSGPQDGLRTTLMVVIASKKEYGIAYIGDGGGLIIRASGQVESFLDPQKADGLQNVLAASLGPTAQGEPVIVTLPRLEGDLLILGTDGVFDRMDSTFAKELLRVCIEKNGDLRSVAEQVLDEIVSFKDAYGYVADDNCTLGIMGDGAPPRLPEGFWADRPTGPVEQPEGVQAVDSRM